MITEEFRQKFSDRVVQFEGGPKLKIYDDGHGVPTIGVGFALVFKAKDEKGKTEWKAYEREELRKKGINLSNEQYEIIKEYAEVKSKEDKPSDNLKSNLKNMDFRITSDTAQKLLNHSINDSHNKIKKTITEETWNGLGLARQIGVMDHCFHHGNILPISQALIDKDFNKAADIMQNTKVEAFKARAELRADYVRHNKLSFEGKHIVGPGDTAINIAKKLGISVEDLIKLNPELKNLNKLQVGQQVNIRDNVSTDHTVKNSELQSPKPREAVANVFSQLVRDCNEILKKCFEKVNDAFKNFKQKQNEILKKSKEDIVSKAKTEMDTTHANHIAKDKAKFAEVSAIVKVESQAKFAAEKAKLSAQHAPNNKHSVGPKTVTIDNLDIVAKYQKIYDQACEQNKKECEEKKAAIAKDYKEIAKQNSEKIKDLISTKKKIIVTEKEALIKAGQKLLDQAKEKASTGETVNHDGIKQQIAQNVNQFLEGVNKHLGVIENVDNTSTPLVGLDVNEGLKAAA